MFRLCSTVRQARREMLASRYKSTSLTGGHAPRLAQTSPTTLVANQFARHPHLLPRQPVFCSSSSPLGSPQASPDQKTNNSLILSPKGTTQRIFEAVDQDQARSRSAGGAGGANTYEAFRRVDEGWLKLRTMTVRMWMFTVLHLGI